MAKLGLILKDSIKTASECSAAIATTLDQRGHWVVADREAVDFLTAWVNNADEWRRLRSRCATDTRWSSAHSVPSAAWSSGVMLRPRTAPCSSSRTRALPPSLSPA